MVPALVEALPIASSPFVISAAMRQKVFILENGRAKQWRGGGRGRGGGEEERV